MSKGSIWPIDMILLGAMIPGRSKPGSDGNKGILRITGASPSDGLLSYPGHSLPEVSGGEGLTPLQRCIQCILKLQLTGLFLSENYAYHIKIQIMNF